MDGAAVEVAGIEERHGAAFGFLAQGTFEAEVHDAPGGDGDAQRCEACGEPIHCFLGCAVAGRGGDVDELLGVVRVDDFGERNDGFGDVAAMLATAAGDGEFVGLVPAFHGMEDDVFLQNAVAAESGLSGFKDVKSSQFQSAQKVFAEWAEVRAVAEAPRRDADELPAGNEQALNEGDEAGVEIAGFDADGTQRASLGGIGADFSIGWICDGGIEAGRMCAK